MAERDLVEVFSDCLDRLAAGQSIEDCLRAYPQFAARLRPMLEAGIVVRRAEAPLEEVLQAQDRVRFRLAQALAESPARRRPFRRLMEIAAALLLVLFAASAAAGIAAQNSLPGDALYGVKRVSESFMVMVTGGNLNIAAQFDQRRINETIQLLAQGRSELVRFRGSVQALNGESWQVEGISVRVMAGTPGSGLAGAGDRVEISGVTTAEGFVLATQVTLLDDLPEPPAPKPTSSPTATSLPTMTADPTLTPTSSPTAAPSPTMTATPSPETKPTHTPAASSTIKPTQTLWPTNTPRPTLAATPTPTDCIALRPDGWIEYRVQPGDTLSALASASGATLEAVMAANCIEDARFIVAGQRLFLPRTPTVLRPTATSRAGDVQPPPANDNNGNDNGDDSGSSGRGRGCSNDNDNDDNRNDNDDDD